jgi:hypothetical protein
MHTYFGVLDSKAPLDLYDPVLTELLSFMVSNTSTPGNPLDSIKPTITVAANALDHPHS